MAAVSVTGPQTPARPYLPLGREYATPVIVWVEDDTLVARDVISLPLPPLTHRRHGGPRGVDVARRVILRASWETAGSGGPPWDPCKSLAPHECAAKGGGSVAAATHSGDDAF